MFKLLQEINMIYYFFCDKKPNINKQKYMNIKNNYIYLIFIKYYFSKVKN